MTADANIDDCQIEDTVDRKRYGAWPQPKHKLKHPNTGNKTITSSPSTFF
jgi:hypothetical protein